MDRRSFVVGLAGLPLVGWGARIFGLPKSKAESGITVHGPEILTVKTYLGRGAFPMLSLRFENVPARVAIPCGDVLNRLRPVCGTVNRSHWHGECARTLMFTDFSTSAPKDRLCTVVCGFTPALDRRPGPGSHRPGDFEKEILKALAS